MNKPKNNKPKGSKKKKPVTYKLEPIIAFDSKIKLGILTLPCLLIVGLGISGLITGVSIIEGGILVHCAMIGISGICSFTLLQMAFDSKPVLVIDENGIMCRRPDIGIIPWRAVVGLGTSRATVLRQVFLVAVDDNELDEKAQQHLRDRISFLSNLSPGVSKFERRLAGYPTFHITISNFSMSIPDFEDRMQEQIRVNHLRS